MQTPDQTAHIDAATARAVELEAELETTGMVSKQGDTLAFAKAALHEWVDTVAAVVASPGVGRVMLIHANGTQTKIASPELPFLVTPPVTWGEK